MKFVSTRKKSPPLVFSECVTASIAPDGGLYVPERFPVFDVSDFEGRTTLAEIAEVILAPFLKGDGMAPRLREICADVFNFAIPLRPLAARPGRGSTSMLELYHGPTAAFKDVGARFLAASLSRMPSQKTRTVIVATSGDTGGAVAGAFHGRAEFEVIVLFPFGKVSARQEKQLTAWGGNVRAFAVGGDFDDCQRVVKQAFADAWWRTNKNLVSANSINIGRLLPQAVYYAAASLWYLRSHGNAPQGFVVPTGNLGNAVAALWAKKMGFAVGRIALATNANRSVADYFLSGQWVPQPTVATLANAMDVGDPSNMERLLELYPTLHALKKDVLAVSVPDHVISETIRAYAADHGEVLCPHTAAAAFVRDQIAEEDWVIVATAHPAKFETVIEPLIGKKIEVPSSLAVLLDKPASVERIGATLAELRAALA